MDDLPLIQLRPSRIGRYLFFLLACLTATAVVISGLSWSYQWIVLAAVVMLVWFQCKMFSALTVSALRCASGQWFVCIQGKEVLVDLHREAMVMPGLITLCVRESQTGRKYDLVLWSDSAAADDLRKLRVLLRFWKR
jgi:hypothetical protein